MPRLFLDLDGVLADMHGYYFSQFGVPATWEMKNFWFPIKQHGTFFRDVPLLSDAMELWRGVKHLSPTIITGCPVSLPTIEQQKREWVRQNIGADVRVICCKSRDKRLHGKPGDVLVDDWVKWSEHWTDMGGVFILHTSAKTSLEQLACMAL